MGRMRVPVRLLAVLLAVECAAAGAGAVVLTTTPPEPRSTAAPSLGRPAAAVDPASRRAAEVRELLDVRARAVLQRDRAAFLGTIDPLATAFRDRQARLFDALAGVPLSQWQYELSPHEERPGDVVLDRRRGRGWWAPKVDLRYALTGFDDVPTVSAQHLTFVRRGEQWYLAADDDFGASGDDSGRGLWDSGPVVAVRGRSSLVLGHPGNRPMLTRIAGTVDAAVPRVTAVWGTGWARKVVVLVPDSQAELERVVGTRGDFSQIAAVATAELARGTETYLPVGDRIVVNPPNFAKLGPLGRRVVLTHEVTHVATRSATGPGTPTWLVEGFADHVGYRGVDLPLQVAARELRALVRRGRVPTSLPTDRDFDGGNADLAAVYEQSWLAVRMLAQEYGEPRLLRFYRAAGQVQGAGRDRAVAQAFAREFGTSLERFTARWSSDLRRRLR